jgi:hypothetical protein
MKRIATLLLCTIAFSDEPFTPWFTGPIVAPNGIITPLGHAEMDNYLLFETFSGAYNDNWDVGEASNFFSLALQPLYYFGITPWMDIQIAPTAFYSFTENQQSLQFGDFTATLDFQLYNNDAFWFPAIKLAISELFPTGKFKNLDPSKLRTDVGGYGTFGTGFSLVLYKIYHLWGKHSMSVTVANTYTINTSTSVKGFNAYGGGSGTKGKVDVGNTYQGICSFEFSLNQNWNLALDTVWLHKNKSPFSGKEGAHMKNPSSESLSCSPAIEYSFSKNLGIIGGVWLSLLGRNSTIFRNAAINMYCFF